MWVFLAILAVPLIEIGLFVTLGGAIGLWPTLAWVLLSAGLGLFVLRRVATEGVLTLRQDMTAMGDPLSPLAQRAMLMMAGILLLLPGFLTDFLGLLLLLKPVRTLLIGLAARRMKIVPMRGPTRPSQQSDVIEGDWREADDAPAPPRRDKPSGWTQH
ncbi:MAG: FxsA family protein [Tabrizicola sp.]|uniref:FxsA family protein n=1 Tax=Tabrizicola sp. TaxID=2005166 RepID=UPI002734DB1F|nr:FxsA family protein [Tabrizicola sp.]MDP3261636.1 FxsA family protein [Tabrizicola sp.]MDP3648294.1 FxsA family protein [Paracoccaceae bacterium]MDZ4065595.1 FxsA family protein [Tabrizicola sp.]